MRYVIKPTTFFRTMLVLGLTLMHGQGIAADAPSILAKVTLFPAGSFEVQSTNVVGRAKKQGNAFTAKEIKVPVSSLVTGISLRDNHMREKLEGAKHPFVVVENMNASKDAGTAAITIAGIKKEITFKFKDLGAGAAHVSFTLNLLDFKIGGTSYKGVGVEDQVEVTATIPYD